MAGSLQGRHLPVQLGSFCDGQLQTEDLLGGHESLRDGPQRLCWEGWGGGGGEGEADNV